MMRARSYILAGLATLALTAASMTAIVAATGGPTPRTGSYGTPGRWRGTSTACTVPSSLPGRRVTVLLGDMGSMMGGGWMMLRVTPPTVPAGRVTLLAVNRGSRTHELVVLPLSSGASVGERQVGSDNAIAEAGSLGEASNDCGTGAGDGIRASSAGWVTLSLKPGRYELVCNLPGHYAAGMFTELDVT